MARTKKAVKSVDKFQAAVDYLTEYAGVRGAVIADSEGLVVAKSGSAQFEADSFGALALELILSLDSILPKLIQPGIEFLTIKTAGDWLTLAYARPFFLVVAANRDATDLLNIRVGRALEMISSHIKNKYPQAVSAGPSGVNAKNMEAVNV